MKQISINDFAKECMSHISFLYDTIDSMDEELERQHIDLMATTDDRDNMTARYNELKDYPDKLRKATAALNNMAAKLERIRQLMIDNIIITLDSDGKEQIEIVAYPRDTEDICNILEITEADWCE